MDKIRSFFAKHPRVLMAVSGLLLGATVVFAEVGIFAYLALVPLAAALFGRASSEGWSVKRAYVDGLVFYLCYDIVCFHWIAYFYPLDFLGFSTLQSLGVVVLGWFGLSVFQSIFSALVFVLLSCLARARICRGRPVMLAPLAAALFALNEWTQTLTWAGIPWARIVISQTQMPILMQTSSLLGSYFLTFLIVLVNFLLAYAIVHREGRRAAALVALVAFALNAGVGAVLYSVPYTEGDDMLVVSIQGSQPSQDMDITSLDVYLLYEEMTIKAAESGASVVVWPENVIGTLLSSTVKTADGKYTRLESALSSLAQRAGATLIVGHFTIDELGDRYNSLSAFYADGTSELDVYAKIRIVPFGEYVPMRGFIEAVLPVLGSINFFGQDATPGKESTSFPAYPADDAPMISALICFDSIYEKLGIDSVRAGGEVFVVPSNDSWFYDSRALDMHHAQNILRAVECGRYTVSSGNTGITSVISDKGEVLDRLPIFTEDYLVANVRPSTFRTLYSYIGNAFVFICAVFVALPLVFEAYASIRDKRARVKKNEQDFV